MQLEQLQQQRESLERERQEVETLNSRKRELISAQTELTERLSSTLQRVERDMGALLGWLERLDKASLAEQRRLTIPFIRGLLEVHRPGEQG